MDSFGLGPKRFSYSVSVERGDLQGATKPHFGTCPVFIALVEQNISEMQIYICTF